VTNDARRDDASEPSLDPSEVATDALRQLEERLDRASRAAERLIAQARAEVASEEPPQAPPDGEPPRAGTKPPSAGWQAPRSASEGAGELELLAQLVQSLRDLLPPDLQRRLTEAIRELLLALRALIDFYLERLERRAPAPAKIEDIPIT
jgi:hypothetical protein